MASGRPRRPNDPSIMSSLESAVREVRRTGPIAASLGVVWLAAAAGAGLAAIGALLRWPPARNRIIARAWCVITPHRIRAGCANAWVQSRYGRLPIVLTAVPTEFGERVQLWCRAGITAADLFAARHVLAAACWAAEVRVIPSARHAHLVTLEVIRNQQPERTEPALRAWPFSRYVEGDQLDDPEEPASAASVGTNGSR